MRLYDRRFFGAQADFSQSSANRVLATLFETWKPASIADFGCGVGSWLAAADGLGVEDYIGLDGAEAAEEALRIPPSRFRREDLTGRIDLGRRFDLVMSLEVAEHLPPQSAPVFVETLTRHGDAVLFSAALPYQGGSGHQNENWLEYWSDLFDGQGFGGVDILRPAIWDDEDIAWWYRQNTVLFVNRARRDHPLAKPAAGALRSMAHPEFLLESLHRGGRPRRGRRRAEDVASWRRRGDPPLGYGPEYDYAGGQGGEAESYADLKAMDLQSLPPALADALAPVSEALRTPPELTGSDAGPDVIGVGVQKAATTWLFDVLRSHRGVFLPPVKEVNFFNRRAFAKGMAWSGFGAQERIKTLCRNYCVNAEEISERWFAYLGRLMAYEDGQSWYEGVFSAYGKNRIKGDITPSYCLLPEREIRNMLRINPDLKIIMILRDPVDRVRSQLDMIAKQAPAAVPFLDDIAFEPSVLGRSRYEAFVPLWAELVPPDRLLLAQSEGIAADPRGFAVRLARFLGVDPGGFDARIVEARSHASDGSAAASPALIERLEETLAPSRRWLAEEAPRLSGPLW